jgi:acyl carrier protein
MNRDEIIKVLIESTEKVTRKPADRELINSKKDLNFREDLNLDSLDMLEIIDELDARFKITLSPEALAANPSLDNLISMIVAARSAAPAGEMAKQA